MSLRNKILNIGCAKGFADKTPLFMSERQKILSIIDGIYKRHGAEKLETPVFELKELFSSKTNKCTQLLDLNDQGGEILALRYDLKHPLTRYLSMNKIEKHMKISQTGCVYRNEQIDLEKYRLREFFVSDFDICGPTDPMIAEVQCLRMCCDIIRELELGEPVRLLIGHKKMTELIWRSVTGQADTQAIKSIGKLAENTVKSGIDWTSFEKSMGDKNISKSVIDEFQSKLSFYSGPIATVVERLSNESGDASGELSRMKESKAVLPDLLLLASYIQLFLPKSDWKNIEFDFSVIGSRSFYTGVVFAARLQSTGFNLMSGGRYDNLISKIIPKSKDRISCTGFTIGVDQLVMHRLSLAGERLDAMWDTNGHDNGAIIQESCQTKEKTNIKSNITAGDENLLKNVKGTIDRNPQQMVVRERVFNTIIDCFKRHNAGTIDTPVVERYDVLMGKYGEDSKLIYDLNDVDNEKLSLRYDLTVPFARYLAMHDDVFELDNVFKRYQIGKVYRRDNPSLSRGRYREFYQCDFDIAGTSEDVMQPDFECLSIVYEVLRDLNLGDYKIKVNHRKFLDGMLSVCGVPDKLFRTICSSIDKLDKTPWETVQEEMLQKGLSSEVAKNIGKYVGLSGGVDLIDKLESDSILMTSENIKLALMEMRILFKYCSNMMDKIRFDLSLARGLDYYTGMIFEAVFTDFESKPQENSGSNENEEEKQASVGSVSGGGRYDNLVNMFSTSDKIIPCVGLSIGVERLMAIFEKTRMSEIKPQTSKQVMVITAQKNIIEERFKLLSMLLEAGITATHSMKKNPKALDMFQECERLEIPYAVIVGEDELKEDSVKLRNISTRKEEMVPRSDIINRIKTELCL